MGNFPEFMQMIWINVIVVNSKARAKTIHQLVNNAINQRR